MTPTANTSIRRVHERRDSESATPDPGRSAPEAIPPDKTKATAGNGGESQNFKASDLLLSSLPDGTDFTSEDRHAAYCCGYADGMHHRLGLEVEDRARALLLAWSRESRNMATHYAAKVGPHWLALITECSEVDD